MEYMQWVKTNINSKADSLYLTVEIPMILMEYEQNPAFEQRLFTVEQLLNK